MDLYKILGVGKNATPEEIKKAFRKKAKQFHPDLNSDHQEIFKQITHAYNTLIDPEKRKKYDKALKNFEKKDFSRVVGDILADFLGFHTKPVSGEKITIKINLSVEEGYFGTVKTIKYKRKVRCEKCAGRGITSLSRITECQKCRGSGRVKKAFIEIPCFECFGRGFVIKNPCPVCRGSGRTLKLEKKNIKIPAGVLDGQSVVVEGGGNEGINGGKSGDLILKIKIKNGKFRLKKLDLTAEIKIKKETLAEGGFISIADIEGNRLRLPVEPSEKPVKIRIKNRGYRDTTGKRGDLVIKLIPV